VQTRFFPLPWGHNIDLLAVKDPAIRLWYAEAAIEHGWSRPVLAAQMDSQLHVREAQAVTNFTRTLPRETSELAQQILKDPYHFDFLSLAETAHERAVEAGLIARIRDFLLELGKGFAFVASQHHIEIGEQGFYVDLLFYHRKLKCLVALDLKSGAFVPEHADKMNFYLAALDDRDREAGDNPSIDLILCRQHNRVVVGYALRGVAAIPRLDQALGSHPLTPAILYRARLDAVRRAWPSTARLLIPGIWLPCSKPTPAYRPVPADHRPRCHF
jgi:predicted nuclease of restriction endonuclease-like (RecB) superfamily